MTGPLDPAGSPTGTALGQCVWGATGACRGQPPGPHALGDLVADGRGLSQSALVLTLSSPGGRKGR